ncbi:uncharacterized protein [Pocillopora verrucosa]|uniref:uncharacterized protein isoform X1 n=1 Tax=Pocillopora verrucosa TaxID=203993 RepID=UPI0027972F2C|nr:uncharacterized protein LOC131769469 [Pocillopora verrucosa]
MEKYVRIVQKLTSLNIKLVAVDFDQTIINMHTCGVWQFSSKSLVPRVRPSFKQFFKAALSCGDLHVAIVTKSPQISLIREVMEQALPECDTSRIHYRGADGEWKEVKGVSKEGKQQHIQSVIQQIEKDHKVKIKREEVILLDDDETNISEARNSKMKTLLVKGDDSLDELLEARYWSQVSSL